MGLGEAAGQGQGSRTGAKLGPGGWKWNCSWRKGGGEELGGTEGAWAKPHLLTIAGVASQCILGPGYTRSRRTGRTCGKGGLWWARALTPHPNLAPSPPHLPLPSHSQLVLIPRAGGPGGQEYEQGRTETQKNTPLFPSNPYRNPFPQCHCPGVWLSSERRGRARLGCSGHALSPLTHTHTHTYLV